MKRILRICNLICNKVPILRNVFHPGRYIVCFGLEMCTTLVDQVMARVRVRVRVRLWLRLCLPCGCVGISTRLQRSRRGNLIKIFFVVLFSHFILTHFDVILGQIYFNFYNKFVFSWYIS